MARKNKIIKTISQQISSLFKTIIKNFKKIPILIQLVLLLCLILIVFRKNRMELFENRVKNGDVAEITFFHMKGCGHCNKMKEEWNSFNNNWNDNSIIINDKEQSQARDLCEKYNITGFPTIIFTVNGEVPKKSQNQEHLFNEERSSENFKEWANEMKEKFLEIVN